MFKRRAAEVENFLVSKGFSVRVNTEKPRKGSFVVRIGEESKPVIELLALPRPFKKLREIDLLQCLESAL